MKLSTLLSILAVLILPVESPAQTVVAPNAGASGRQEPGGDNLSRDTLSQSDLKRLTEKIEQWNRVEGNVGVPPQVAKVRTTAMLTVLKLACEVSEASYRGTAPDDAGQQVYEAACENGMGYLLRLKHSVLTGVSCLASDREESPVKCTLPGNTGSELSPGVASAAPPNGDTRPSLSWFKEALSRNGVSCESKRARIVGRESIKRRYLVEFECPDRPEGLVAFVPPAGDTVNSFESMNCLSAAERGIRCELLVKP